MESRFSAGDLDVLLHPEQGGRVPFGIVSIKTIHLTPEVVGDTPVLSGEIARDIPVFPQQSGTEQSSIVE